MDEIRQAWGSFLKRVGAEIAKLWGQLSDGIGEEWDIRIFLILMAVVVIVTAISIGRRRA
jgi:hypothetical protein